MPSGYFMPAPSINLMDEAALRSALADTSWRSLAYPGPYLVRSQWLIDLIAEIAQTEYPKLRRARFRPG